MFYQVPSNRSEHGIMIVKNHTNQNVFEQLNSRWDNTKLDASSNNNDLVTILYYTCEMVNLHIRNSFVVDIWHFVWFFVSCDGRQLNILDWFCVHCLIFGFVWLFLPHSIRDSLADQFWLFINWIQIRILSIFYICLFVFNFALFDYLILFLSLFLFIHCGSIEPIWSSIAHGFDFLMIIFELEVILCYQVSLNLVIWPLFYLRVL